MGTYTLTLQGVAGPESDITKARVYVNGAQQAEVGVTPGVSFQTQVTHPIGNVNIQVEHSFLDSTGNESAKRSQMIFIPDKEAPAIPSGPLNLISVVWA